MKEFAYFCEKCKKESSKKFELGEAPDTIPCQTKGCRRKAKKLFGGIDVATTNASQPIMDLSAH